MFKKKRKKLPDSHWEFRKKSYEVTSLSGSNRFLSLVDERCCIDDTKATMVVASCIEVLCFFGWKMLRTGERGQAFSLISPAALKGIGVFIDSSFEEDMIKAFDKMGELLCQVKADES